MPKTVAIANQKGGVGKTTTAIHLAAGLALAGHRSLIIDVDPQANATAGLGFPKKADGPTVYDLLVNDFNVHDVIRKTSVSGLEIVPSDNRLYGAEIELVTRPEREHVLTQCLRGVDETFSYVFFDCPPALGLLTLNALVAADSIIVPMQCEYFALEGLAYLMETVKLVQRRLNPRLRIEGIVLTMFDNRLNLTRQVANEIVQVFGDRVYKTSVARNVRLSEAPSFGQPVYSYDPGSKGAQNYRELVNEFLSAQRDHRGGIAA